MLLLTAVTVANSVVSASSRVSLLVAAAVPAVTSVIVPVTPWRDRPSVPGPTCWAPPRNGIALGLDAQPLHAALRTGACSFKSAVSGHQLAVTITAPVSGDSAAATPGVHVPQEDSRLLVETLVQTTTVVGRSVLDLCTGTGVLAIAAARMGATSVTAWDICSQGFSAVARMRHPLLWRWTFAADRGRKPVGADRSTSCWPTRPTYPWNPKHIRWSTDPRGPGMRGPTADSSSIRCARPHPIC